MKFITSLFNTREAMPSWGFCSHAKTLSFRDKETLLKTDNPIFLDPLEGTESPESWFTDSTKSASFSTESKDLDAESVVKGVRSERLFFEPGGETSSILEEAKAAGKTPFKESVALAMESEDPFVDFRRSMEEMVEAHELRDRKCLEELLGWYLRANGKDHHGFILGAFVDLLVSLSSSSASSSSCSDSKSYFSAVSSFSSSSASVLCPYQGQSEIDKGKRSYP